MEFTPYRSVEFESLRRDAPQPGQFLARSCVLGEDEADIVIGLFDHRVLAIECKASNSEINSRKRINKEIGQNARNWVARFGTDDFVLCWRYPRCVQAGLYIGCPGDTARILLGASTRRFTRIGKRLTLIAAKVHLEFPLQSCPVRVSIGLSTHSHVPMAHGGYATT